MENKEKIFKIDADIIQNFNLRNNENFKFNSNPSQNLKQNFYVSQMIYSSKILSEELCEFEDYKLDKNYNLNSKEKDLSLSNIEIASPSYFNIRRLQLKNRFYNDYQTNLDNDKLLECNLLNLQLEKTFNKNKKLFLYEIKKLINSENLEDKIKKDKEFCKYLTCDGFKNLLNKEELNKLKRYSEFKINCLNDLMTDNTNFKINLNINNEMIAFMEDEDENSELDEDYEEIFDDEEDYDDDDIF